MLFFFTNIILCLLAAISPGPNFVLVSSTAIRKGRQCGIEVVKGIIVGTAFWMFVCAIGASWILTNPLIKNSFLVLGGIYFIYLSVNIITQTLSGKSKIESAEVTATANPQPRGIPLFRQGIIASLLNPGLVVIFSVLFINIANHYKSLGISLLYAILFTLIETIYFFSLNYFLNRSQAYIKRFESIINLALGITLLGMGIKMALIPFIGHNIK